MRARAGAGAREPAPRTDACGGFRLRSRVAQLTGFFSIPFVATLMARGVSYDDGFDWHIGAGLVALGSVGAGVKYVKEALSFEVPGEDVEVSA